MVETNQVKFITEKELAQITGFALQTIRNWRHVRRGPNYVKISRAVRYDYAEVMLFMNSRRVNLEREDRI